MHRYTTYTVHTFELRHTVFASIITDFGALALKLFIHCHKPNNEAAHQHRRAYKQRSTHEIRMHDHIQISYWNDVVSMHVVRAYATKLQSGRQSTQTATKHNNIEFLYSIRICWFKIGGKKIYLFIFFSSITQSRSIGRTTIKSHTIKKKEAKTQIGLENSNCMHVWQ